MLIVYSCPVSIWDQIQSSENELNMTRLNIAHFYLNTPVVTSDHWEMIIVVQKKWQVNIYSDLVGEKY